MKCSLVAVLLLTTVVTMVAQTSKKETSNKVTSVTCTSPTKIPAEKPVKIADALECCVTFGSCSCSTVPNPGCTPFNGSHCYPHVKDQGPSNLDIDTLLRDIDVRMSKPHQVDGLLQQASTK